MRQKAKNLEMKLMVESEDLVPVLRIHQSFHSSIERSKHRDFVFRRPANRIEQLRFEDLQHQVELKELLGRTPGNKVALVASMAQQALGSQKVECFSQG